MGAIGKTFVPGCDGLEAASRTPGLTVEGLLATKRNELGWSRRELGRRSGLSVAYVSAVEAGRIAPSLRAFSRLATQLELNGMELLAVIRIESTRPIKHGAVTPPDESKER